MRYSQPLGDSYFWRLILYTSTSHSHGSVFIAIALRIWARNKFEKIYTRESDGFLLLPRASLGKAIVGVKTFSKEDFIINRAL